MRTARWIPLEVQSGGLASREPVSLYQDSRSSAPWPAAPPVSPGARKWRGCSCNRGPAPLSGRKQRAEKPILSFFPSRPSLPSLPSPLFSGSSFPFFSLPLSSQETSPPPQSPAPKVFPFYGLESKVLEVMVRIKI